MTGIKRAEPKVAPSRKRRTPPEPPIKWPPFEGAKVLDEIGGELGLLLFQRARDVLLWSRTDAGNRSALFNPRSPSRFALKVPGRKGELIEIGAELAVLEEMVLAPGSADEEQIAATCIGIYHWCLDRVFYATATLYASAAASACPLDPMFSIYAARAERAQASFERALLWFQRAKSLARRAGKLSAYTVALLGWANLEIERGRTARAQALLLKASRYARRHNLRHLAAEARHDLLALAIDLEDYENAELHARAAFQLYGPRSRSIFALAHDWALVWVKKGYFATALPVIEAALPHLAVPSARILALSSIALASGVLGFTDNYRTAADAVLRLAAVAVENTPIALVHIAEGAHASGQSGEARTLVLRARELARGRQDATAEKCADRLIAAIREHTHLSRMVVPPADVVANADTLLERVHRAARSL